MSDSNTGVNRRRSPSSGYVKLHRSIWHDPDFTALSTEAQHMYLLLMSQPDITHVGIVPYMPPRWARLAAGMTVSDLHARLDELTAANFVLVDTETLEVLVRSYAVYDEAWKLTNGPKSLVNAHAKVYSPRLRNAIMTVLATLDVTVDSTVEVTLDATVDVTVSAHKTETYTSPAPPTEPLRPPSKAHPMRDATLFAAAASIIKRKPPAHEITNVTGYTLKVKARLANEWPNVDALIEALGMEDAVERIVRADTGMGVSTDAPTVDMLRSAREYGAAVKAQHIAGEYADMPDLNRETFLSELQCRDEDEEWHNAAIHAYDEYAQKPNLRAV